MDYNAQQLNPIAEGMHASQNIQVDLVKAFFIEVPAENPVHYRPHVMTFNDNTFRKLRDITADGISINAAAIRQVARDIVQQSHSSQGKIAIDNGWDAHRFAFYLLFRVTTPSQTMDEVITGYTDHTGRTIGNGANSQHWDYNMTLQVNSHMKVSERQTVGTYGAQSVYTGRNINQILRPTHIELGGYTVGTTESATAMRPVDALYSLQKSKVSNPGQVHDTRTTIRSGNGEYGMASSRKNEMSSEWVSKVLTGYSHAYRQTDGQHNELFTLGTAASVAREADLETSPVFRRLAERTSYAEIGYLTMGELMGMFPYLDEVTQCVRLPPNSQMIRANDVNGWGGANEETRLAHALSHAVPSVMTSALTVSCSFTAWGPTPDGGVNIAIENLIPIFDSIRDTDLYDRLCATIVHEVILEVIPEPGIDFHIQMDCSLFGRSTITVGLYGRPLEVYTAPNYADGLTASTIAVDENHLLDTANKTGMMLDTVFSQSVDPGMATAMSNF